MLRLSLILLLLLGGCAQPYTVPHVMLAADRGIDNDSTDALEFTWNRMGDAMEDLYKQAHKAKRKR